MDFISVPEFDATGLVTTFSTTKDAYGWRHTPSKDEECYDAVVSHFGLSRADIVGFNLNHTSNVYAVDRSNGGEGVYFPSDKGDFDGIITNEKGLLLTTISADCTPVFILDPVKKAIGMIHSGWRGTAGKISVKAIELMGETYGTKASDVLVALGPSICKDCYEVSGDLLEAFAGTFTPEELGKIFSKSPSDRGQVASQVKQVEGSKTDAPENASAHYQLDLAEAIRISLVNAGVPESQITMPRYCTCHDDKFYSWRKQSKEGLAKDDFLSGIMLK